MLEIRFMQANVKDYQVFKPMHENLSYIDVGSMPSYPRAPTITDYETFIKEIKQNNFFFIDLNGQPIGYIILDAFNSGISQIREICIIPKYQRHGYGKEAIRQLVEILKADDTISVIKVISATIATDFFYKNCGFHFTTGDTFELQV